MTRLITFIFLGFFLSGMSSPPFRVGGPAPSFELKAMDGRVFKSSDLKNKMIILNFWATWCVPCIKEMPELNKAYYSLKDSGVEIIAVNFAESRSEVDEFVSEHHLGFPVFLDEYGDTAQDYKVRSLPVTYFISPDGIVVDVVFGGVTQELIETKLKEFESHQTE